MSFDELLKKRASIRNFSDKKPSEEQILDIIEAGNLAPSPGNLPIANYIIIEDQEKISKIADACQQEFIKKAPIVIVINSNPENIKIMYDKRAEKYVHQQIGAAIENMLLKIADLKLASCWVGAYSEITIRNILKIPDKIEIEAVLPIGYQSKIDKTTQKIKPPLQKRLFFEKYGIKEKLKEIKIKNN